MDEEDQAYWEEAWQVLAEKFSLPSTIRTHIETMATRQCGKPWEYVLHIFWEDFDRQQGQPKTE